MARELLGLIIAYFVTGKLTIVNSLIH